MSAAGSASQGTKRKNFSVLEREEILSEDDNLRPFLDTWDAFLQEALNKAKNLVVLQRGGGVNADESGDGDGRGADPPEPGPGDDGAEGGGDGEDGDADGGVGSADGDGDGDSNSNNSSTGESISGSSSTPPKKRQPQGTTVHVVQAPSNSEPESNKRRRCKVWAPAKTRSGRNVRKRNKNDDTDKASTAKKNTAESSGLLENLNDLADQTLLHDTPAANTRLGTIIGAVQQCLHPSGSMTLFVPHPWHTHVHRLTDAVQQPGTAMSVEENYLVLQYSGRLGGRPSTSATSHLRRSLDCVVLAHNSSSGKAFTCNTRVTVDDVYGQHNLGGPAAPVLPLMSQVPFPGADTDFPERTLQFLINRFTRPGDTVLSVCGESNEVIEISLNRARRVEVVMANKASTKDVTKRMDDSFLMGYREGKFKAPTQQTNREVMVGPDHFPQHLPIEDVTPDKVKDALATTSESGVGDSEAAELVAESVAADFNWTIERADAADPLPSLHPRDGVSYPPGSSDVALWGTLVVYRSRLEAWKSLSDDDKEGQYVRLVKVAINKQLSKLLVPGKELGGPTAELFLRVAPTCPAYYAL
eukprot:jgi/Undpi1/2045/HiC_scaffold_12.g05431.m1